MNNDLVVLVDAELPAAQAQKLRQLSARVQVRNPPAGGGALLKADLAEASVIYTTAADFDPADAPKLRWVQLNTAAASQVLGKPVARSRIPVATVSGAYSVAVAECAMAMLLALSRRVPLCHRWQTERFWPDDYLPARGEDLHGKTMAIVGYGSIGRQIARLAQGFGMTVLACKRDPHNRRDNHYRLPNTGDPEGQIPKAFFGPGEMAAMFGQCDVAVVTLPSTPATRGLVGRDALAALPKHAYFLNVGRGAVVDEAALVERLQAGRIAGAALDVFVDEPLPAASPLWELSNVLILPHIASWTDMQTQRAAEVLIENARRDLAGEALVNVIDRALEY